MHWCFAIAVGVERLITLVVIVVPAEDDVDAGPDQEAPDRLHRLEAPVLTRTPARIVPVREGTPCWMGGEVRFQPLILWRLLVASTDRLAIRVQDDDVPFRQVVGVSSLAGKACPRTEVLEVRTSNVRAVFMIADHQAQAILQQTAKRSQQRSNSSGVPRS